MKLPLQFEGSYDWARAQRINLLVFVAVALLGWAFGQQYQFLIGTCVYTLCCGNLSFLAGPPLFRIASRYRGAALFSFLIAAGLVLGVIGSSLQL